MSMTLYYIQLFAYAAGAIDAKSLYIPMTQYYEEAAQYMLNSKLSTGQNQGNNASEILGVNNKLTRAQAVTFFYRAMQLNLLNLTDNIRYLVEKPLFTPQNGVIRSYDLGDNIIYYILQDEKDGYEIQVTVNNRIVGGYYSISNGNIFGHSIGKAEQKNIKTPSYYNVVPMVDSHNNSNVYAVLYMYYTYDRETQQAMQLYNVKNIEMVAEIYAELLNKFRASFGEKPLKPHYSLTAAAKAHSIDMADLNYYSHTSLNGLEPSDRVKQIDPSTSWRSIGENLTAGGYSIFAAHNQWVNSFGHRSNMLKSNRTHVGFGIGYNKESHYKLYYTTKFGNL